MYCDTRSPTLLRNIGKFAADYTTLQPQSCSLQITVVLLRELGRMKIVFYGHRKVAASDVWCIGPDFRGDLHKTEIEPTDSVEIFAPPKSRKVSLYF